MLPGNRQELIRETEIPERMHRHIQGQAGQSLGAIREQLEIGQSALRNQPAKLVDQSD